MKIADIPSYKFPIPFGNNAAAGLVRDIPTNSQIGIQDGAASLYDGFVPLNFLPVGSGGVPPWGQDFNGLFKAISAWTRWQNVGGLVSFDASFATTIGGYPKGAIVAGSAPGVIWLCTSDDNANNPNSGGAGWIQLAGLGDLLATGWVNVLSISTTTPPVSPAVNDTYLIPAGATGAWSGQSGKLARWNGLFWIIIATSDGHAVSTPDQHVYMRTGGAYSEFLATTTLAALSRKATLAEVDAAANVNAYIGPDVLGKTLETQRSKILADVAWPNATFQIINWNDYVAPPSFATLSGGVYTLTRKGTYLVVAQLAHDCPNASSINIYWKKVTDPSAVLVSSNSQTTGGTANNALSVSYVLPGTDVSVGDTIDARVYFSAPGGPYHVDKQTTPGMPTSFSISRIGN